METTIILISVLDGVLISHVLVSHILDYLNRDNPTW